MHLLHHAFIANRLCLFFLTSSKSSRHGRYELGASPVLWRWSQKGRREREEREIESKGAGKKLWWPFHSVFHWSHGRVRQFDKVQRDWNVLWAEEIASPKIKIFTGITWADQVYVAWTVLWGWAILHWLLNIIMNCNCHKQPSVKTTCKNPRKGT